MHNLIQILSTDIVSETVTAAALDDKTIITCSIASVIIGLVIAFAFCFKQKKSKSFMMTLTALPLIVQTVIMLVNGNIGTGVAVMGAFSLVRFRSVPGSAKEISAIFLAMAVGLATGTNHIELAMLLTAVVCVICLIFTLLPIAKADGSVRELTVVIPESLDYTGAFDDIFEKYTNKCELVSVKTTNMGSLFKLKYDVIFKEKSAEKQTIDELRCRNGNLEIMCSKPITQAEQL